MKIIAITACPSGVAHTHMAAAALEKKSKELGFEIHIEKQGAMGIENKLKQSDIDEADVMILAVDTAIAQKERFDNKKIYKCSVTDAVRKTKEVIENAIELVK